MDSTWLIREEIDTILIFGSIFIIFGLGIITYQLTGYKNRQNKAKYSFHINLLCTLVCISFLFYTLCSSYIQWTALLENHSETTGIIIDSYRYKGSKYYKYYFTYNYIEYYDETKYNEILYKNHTVQNEIKCPNGHYKVLFNPMNPASSIMDFSRAVVDFPGVVIYGKRIKKDSI